MSDSKFPPTGGGATLLTALADGEVLADDGSTYGTVQAAENAATDWAFVPPATFNESVTIDTAGLTLMGTGRGSLIDGGSSVAIDVSEANVVIRNLAVQNTSGGGGGDAIEDTSGASVTKILHVWVLDSDRDGIRLSIGADHTILGCVVESADNDAFGAHANRMVVSGCVVETGVGGKGVDGFGHDLIITNNLITGVGNHGVDGRASDHIISDNRIHNAGDDGIHASGTDQLIANNRVSGSTNQDVDTSSATTPTTDANVTGSAN